MWYLYNNEDENENQEENTGLGGMTIDGDSEGEQQPEEEQKKDGGKNGDGKQELDPKQVKDGLKEASDNLDKSKGENGSSGNSNSSGDTANKGNETPSSKGSHDSSSVKPKSDISGNAGNNTTGSGGTPTPSGGNGVATQGGTVATEGGTAVAKGGTAVAEGGATAGTATAAAGTGAAAATIGSILFIAFWVILAIIVIVGILAFFLFMPGQIAEKVKQMGVAFLDEIQGFVEGGKQNVVHSEEIANVADYLERMGYDLKGEGFVSDSVSSDEAEKLSNANLDVSQDVYRDNDTDKIVAINSNPIKTYLVSDNLCYLVKNANLNISDAMSSNPVYVIASVAAIVAGFIISPVVGAAALFTFVAVNGGNPNWGSGLISIYHEGSAIGKRGAFYSDIERGYIELDPHSKQLKIKRGWTNNAYSFDVDGWSGRYGMPLEFLLSVHIATQMPDLAMDMATSFDTDVQVLLHPVDHGEVLAGFLKSSAQSGATDDDFVTWDEVMDIVQKDNNLAQDGWNGFINWVGSWSSFISSSDFQAYNLTDMNYFALFQAGLPHAENCTCCDHIYPNQTGRGSDKNDGKDQGMLGINGNFRLGDHVICEACKTNIKKIITALKSIEDKNWNSYTPYIAKVTDHWFRDVYFVIDDINNTEVVVNDEAYFYETNERWSLYETYKEGDEIPEGFVVGDYILYEYDSSTNSYEPWKYSKEEAEKRNNQIAEGNTSVSRLVKKAVTKRVSDIKDAEGNSVITGVNGNKWTAYATEDTSMNWTKMEMTDDTSEVLAVFEGKLYYKESRPSDIKQIEDGQRTATNPKIKKMFVDNKYYQYDGTVEKADKIIADKKANNSTTEDIKKNNTSEDKRDESLLGKVSITKDSLTAFSMLENTHTLDADYIYKDFKELIVELNYFDKEDLSDKIAEVMTWPLPETGSSGWPIRKYEKSNIFYGTLINSKIDVDLMRTADIEAAEAEIAQLTNEDGSTSSATVNPTGNVARGSVSDLVNKGYEVHKIMEDGVGGRWDYCVYDDASNSGHHRYGNPCGLDSTIQEAQANHHNTCCATYVSWVLKEAGFDLSNHPNMHGAKTSYDWCVAEGFTPITDYNELQPGDLLFNRYDYNGSDVSQIGHIQMLGNNGEWLNAGSVDAINKSPEAYTAKFIIGMRSKMNGSVEEFKGYKPNEPVVAPITGKVIESGNVTRMNVETGKKETVEFIKIQAIDNYVYDIKDNTIYDKNGTGLSNTEGKGYTFCKSEKESETFEKKASEEAKKLEGYDYFFDEYNGVLESYVLYIEGFDLTLYDADGAKALVESGDLDSADVTRYEENTVYNMVDDLEEARSWWKEDAKASAIPVVEINGELYVKEGTVIGKTYEDPADMSEIKVKTIVDADGNEINSCSGNGNYIRLILRNLDDSIVEDVESYFNITDTYSFNGSALNIQNIESLSPELAALIERLAGPLESQYPGIVNILKAISMNESSGGTDPSCMNDPMQSAESTGAAVGSDMGSWENSVNAAIAAVKRSWDKANGYGIKDLRVVIQGYNYGEGFVDYVHNQGSGTYTKQLAEGFSNMWKQKLGSSVYGDPNYIDPKIYKYLPDLNV